MNPTCLIEKKRDGKILSDDEITFIVNGVVSGEISEAQTGALLMAIYFKGLSDEETGKLAIEMARSGEMLDLSSILGTVDKHSTGGVGDKTTLVVAPLVAAAGVPVPKLSGRSLGHTGGTIDKLEAIPNFRTNLSTEEFISQIREIGVAIGGQTGKLVPADKKLYAMRDKTATVEVIPLIASSVMSKKLAGGAQGIVLDVKCGSGAFVNDLERATELASAMVSIGKSAGRRVCALVTSMDQPLGRAVGDGVETHEAIMTLKGEGPADFTELCCLVASHMVWLGGKAESPEDARSILENLLSSGKALEKFGQMVAAQGGDAKIVDNPEILLQAKNKISVKSDISGYIQRIDSKKIGRLAREIVSNHAGGIFVERKVGDRISAGEKLVEIASNLDEKLDFCIEEVKKTYEIGEKMPEKKPILLKNPIF